MLLCAGCNGCLGRNVKELKHFKFWRAVLGEMVGTSFLCIIGCGSCIGDEWETFAPTQVQISLTFGLAIATMVHCLNHISGGHLNPAVSLAMFVTRRITLVRFIFYVLAQCCGAVIGGYALFFVTPSSYQGNLGLTSVNGIISVEQALGVETIITALLVLTVFASSDKQRVDLHGSGPLAVGLSVTLCHLFAIKYTGSSMNPARTLGPAFVMEIWDNHWIYWLGPCAGATIAGLFYEFLFAAEVSTRKIKRYFRDPDYSAAINSANFENKQQLLLPSSTAAIFLKKKIPQSSCAAIENEEKKNIIGQRTYDTEDYSLLFYPSPSSPNELGIEPDPKINRIESVIDYRRRSNGNGRNRYRDIRGVMNSVSFEGKEEVGFGNGRSSVSSRNSRSDFENGKNLIEMESGKDGGYTRGRKVVGEPMMGISTSTRIDNAY